MMNLGATTKSWGAVQDQRPTGDKGKKMGATGEDPFGGKDVGTVANEIADPNYVDPKKIQRERKSDLDKDAFFKLMLTQMKNQDPMNPMQSHEMAAHLAQFTSLEQMFNVNSNLEAMRKAQSPMKDYQALSFIGKDISADSSMVVRYKDDATHELRFGLLGDAAEAKVVIKNEAGETVRELKMTDLKKGKNSLHWDGRNDQGQTTNEGEYKFNVEALSNAGKRVTVDTNASGRINGVQFTKKGPLLLIGNQQVYLSDVKKILEPKDAEVPVEQNPTALPPGFQLPNGLSLQPPVQQPAQKPVSQVSAPQPPKMIPEHKKEQPESKQNVTMKAPQTSKRGVL